MIINTFGFFHIPVLVDEVISILDLKPGIKIIDATVGLGGHTKAILEKILPSGKLLGIDADLENLQRCYSILKAYDPLLTDSGFKSNHSHVEARVVLYHGNFAAIHEIAHACGFVDCDGILFDLGLSSAHLEKARRGFSFQSDGPLDMRFDSRQTLTAATVVNTYAFEKLIQIFRDYGEERFSTPIARRILQFRQNSPIKTTKELVDIITSIKRRVDKIHPATKIFQALRIEVNNEIYNLKQALNSAIELLVAGGRVVVISYHSLEDRIVKEFFRSQAYPCVCPPDFPFCTCGKTPTLKVLTKKPIRPSQEEITMNPRSRSAKLRAAKRIDQKKIDQRS